MFFDIMGLREVLWPVEAVEAIPALLSSHLHFNFAYWPWRFIEFGSPCRLTLSDIVDGAFSLWPGLP